MKGGEEAVADAVVVEARGHARVAGAEARAERVNGHVEPAGVEVEADGGGDLPGQLVLGGDGEVAAEHVGRPPAAVGDSADEPDEVAFEAVEDVADAGRRLARLVVVHQGVVELGGVPDALGLALFEADRRRQVRLEARVVVGLAGHHPGVVADDLGAGHLGDQVGRQLGGAVVVAAGVAGGRGLVAFVGQVLRRLLRGGDEVAEPGVGATFVGEFRDERRLVGPQAGGGVGELRLLVPADRAADAGEDGVGAQDAGEVQVRGVSHARIPARIGTRVKPDFRVPLVGFGADQCRRPRRSGTPGTGLRRRRPVAPGTGKNATNRTNRACLSCGPPDLRGKKTACHRVRRLA